MNFIESITVINYNRGVWRPLVGVLNIGTRIDLLYYNSL